MLHRPGRLGLPGALLPLCLAASCTGGADLVITNGNVLTPDGTASAAVSIRGDRIVALTPWHTPNTLDAEGGFVMPGFVDHHIHLLNVGLWLLNDRDDGRLFLDVSGVTSLDELSAMIRQRAASLPAGAWITGAGWSQASWGASALPDSSVLDAAAPDHPVFLTRTDAHAGWVNRAALVAAGITAATPDPDGGRIVRDAAGRPTGILLERANELVTPQLPRVADDDIVAAFRLAAGALAARGVVEVDDAGALTPPGIVALDDDFGRYVELLGKADSAEPLAVRVNLMIPAPSATAEALVASPPAGWQLSPRVRMTHLKLFADGALGSRGAALTHPYADDASTSGVPRMTADEIVSLAGRALDAGLDVATHAIGDEAVRRALDAYERLLRDRPALDPGRLRIEHFSYASEDDLARAARLGIVLSIQSNFNGATAADSLGASRVGPANEPRVYAWRRLHELGAVLVEGSDYFARLREPFAGYRDALTLRNAIGDGRSDSPDVRQEALAMQLARIEPGGRLSDGLVRPDARADLIVVERDPRFTPTDQLSRLTVRATVNAGRVTYRASATSRRAPDDDR